LPHIHVWSIDMAKLLRRVFRWTAIAIALVLVLAIGALAVAYFRSDNNCAEQTESTPKNPMRAVVYCDYGDPSVLKLASIEKPSPEAGRVLVRVHASSVNPLEYHYMRGTPYMMRMSTGMRVPKETRIGVDFAGTVEAVGDGVTQFKQGDEVFGIRTGAFADYITVREGSLGTKPSNMSFEQTASVPVAAVTALQALRDKGKVKAGQRVLINGASGGVGTFAVQIAKSMGAQVTGVSSTRNLELVRSLGADEVIDYTKQDYTRTGQRFDVIIDMVGNHGLLANRRAMTPKGTYVIVGGEKGRWIAPMDRFVTAMILDLFVGQELTGILAEVNKADLTVLRDLMQAGKVTPVIDRRYTLDQVPQAVEYLETGRARGKVVINIAQ
jgi:NADPH:quinone reductase-like Zn-dependent oxidoreductase